MQPWQECASSLANPTSCCYSLEVWLQTSIDPQPPAAATDHQKTSFSQSFFYIYIDVEKPRASHVDGRVPRVSQRRRNCTLCFLVLDEKEAVMKHRWLTSWECRYGKYRCQHHVTMITCHIDIYIYHKWWMTEGSRNPCILSYRNNEHKQTSSMQCNKNDRSHVTFVSARRTLHVRLLDERKERWWRGAWIKTAVTYR